MHQNRFFFLIRQSFPSFAGTVLISICLGAVILLAILQSGNSQEKIRLRYCSLEGFVYDLNLIPPRQLGVKEWQIGDYARYRYRRKQAPDSDLLVLDQEVGFHIVGELEKPGSHGYWLKKSGFPQPEAIPTDIYRYVTVNDLRITSQNPSYEDPLNYFPSLFMECDQTSVPLAKLVKLGKKKIQTAAGVFECIHYLATPSWNNKTIEIWASAAILPLGIVRAESETESMELNAFGNDREIPVPRLIQPVIEGVSTLQEGCNSCHGYNNCHEMFFPPK